MFLSGGNSIVFLFFSLRSFLQFIISYDLVIEQSSSKQWAHNEEHHGIFCQFLFGKFIHFHREPNK